MDLPPEKAKLKALDPKTKFALWGKTCLTSSDMTKTTQIKNMSLTPHTPRFHAPSGKIEFKLTSAIPTFCDVLKEGFLHVWMEEDGVWKFVYVKLKNGKLYGYDPSDGKNKTEKLSVEITGELKISESSKRRANSFQLRDFNGRTILAATSKEDMNDWMQLLRKHKRHLKRLV